MTTQMIEKPLSKQIKMQRLYLDWDMAAVHVIDDAANGSKCPTPLDQKDKAYQQYVMDHADIESLFNQLKEPTDIYLETTFESFLVKKHNDLICKAMNLGHRFRTIRTTATSRRRMAMGFSKDDKSNYLDPYIIRDLVNVPNERGNFKHFKIAKVYSVDDDLVKASALARNLLMLMRNTLHVVEKNPKHGAKTRRAMLNFSKVSEKQMFSKRIKALLPRYSKLPDIFGGVKIAVEQGKGEKRRVKYLTPLQIALGNGSYSESILAMVGAATHFSGGSRYRFEQIVGLFEGGFGSQLRSDFYYHRWHKTLRSHARNKSSFAGKITLSQARKSLRWLFHNLKTKQIPIEA